ncbi:MAG: hypothetical protein CMJ18_06890 [Phycisphaeraceae bacterium]|nr:hypothetical protein [Phycisphaeraceae bacterium]
MDAPVDNTRIARMLDEVADRMEALGAGFFRVRAYRRGARTIRALDRPVACVLDRLGPAGLRDLPGIGRSLARHVAEIVRTGRLRLLDQLRLGKMPEDELARARAIGPRLAARIRDRLHIDTLGELDAAARDGRLERVPGIGRRRMGAVRTSIADIRNRAGPAASGHPSVPLPASREPGVVTLLDIDREYRDKAGSGRLPRIAPRRFNPLRAAWLPILHTSRDGRRYTALHSNTARAHELGMSRDWVVIRCEEPGGGSWTIITAQLGPPRGHRIVRGRERECRRALEQEPLLPFEHRN